MSCLMLKHSICPAILACMSQNRWSDLTHPPAVPIDSEPTQGSSKEPTHEGEHVVIQGFRALYSLVFDMLGAVATLEV